MGSRETIFIVQTGELRQGELTTHLSYTDSRVLDYLVQHQSDVVKKETLKQYAWEHTEVTDSSLAKSIAKLREALAPFQLSDDVIVSVPRIGYRLKLDNPSQLLVKQRLDSIEGVQPESAPSPSLITKIRNNKQWLFFPTLISCSLVLIGLSVQNFYQVRFDNSAYYLNPNNIIHSTQIANREFKIIAPRGHVLTKAQRHLIQSIGCDCTYYIEKNDTALILSVYQPDKKFGKTYALPLDGIEQAAQVIRKEIHP
ncbi:winged helix-turn-helix domain-containing protein [Vibrio sp. SCSIO 43135]|uniref:winged helix-turn-helix domain-containing protein n=1 Tax=Vibrio sp. SCSIO 43135 TaxID=2819096 RepID=UPI0020765E81|nr:winged helix-turn-helix domain-containing protein [Vibrio sp. SCSIO 43135]USD43849.1 winged helix-turn-helix domain-containing protein [Vibrio sp. SCSIO 43135]